LLWGSVARATFNEAEILGQLDDCAIKFEFPMLDNGYIYPADVRLHAYADQTRWALIIEDLGYHLRAGDHDGITSCLQYYGNCLPRKPGATNEDLVMVTHDGPDEDTFQEEINWYLRSLKGEIYIRDQLIAFDCTPTTLAKKGISTADGQPTGTELLRSLLPEYRDLLLANEKELRRQIPNDIPLIFHLDQWYHPDLAGDDLPSGNETFQQIAMILCTGDTSLYAPSQPPNTHWSNWPDGGTM
jgi:hypothetical protein